MSEVGDVSTLSLKQVCNIGGDATKPLLWLLDTCLQRRIPGLFLLGVGLGFTAPLAAQWGPIRSLIRPQ